MGKGSPPVSLWGSEQGQGSGCPLLHLYCSYCCVLGPRTLSRRLLGAQLMQPHLSFGFASATQRVVTSLVASLTVCWGSTSKRDQVGKHVVDGDMQHRPGVTRLLEGAGLCPSRGGTTVEPCLGGEGNPPDTLVVLTVLSALYMHESQTLSCLLQTQAEMALWSLSPSLRPPTPAGSLPATKLPRQQFSQPLKRPSRQHQTACTCETQMLMEQSPEWDAKLDSIKSTSAACKPLLMKGS